MPRYFEPNTSRRISGTFGGNEAWKQHDDGGDRDFPTSRSRLRNRIEAQLADQEMTDAARDRHSHHQQPARSSAERVATAPAVVTSTANQYSGRRVGAPEPVVMIKKAPRRFQVMITEGGKMIAVPLN